MLADIFGISRQAVNQNIEFLKKWKEIQSAKNFADWKMAYENSNLTRDVTLYDLSVFNKLAMQLKTDAAMEIRSKFSDILVEVETTGSYNIQKQSPSYMIEDPIERAEAWIKEQKEKRALEAERQALEDQNRVLRAEKETLSTDLELARSTMFTNKRICGMIRDKFNIKYADSTLKKKTSKALQAIANELNENITYRTEFVDGILRSIPYYTLQTANRLIQRLESDCKYLKQY